MKWNSGKIDDWEHKLYSITKPARRFSMCKSTKTIGVFLDCTILLNMIKYRCDTNSIFSLQVCVFTMVKMHALISIIEWVFSLCRNKSSCAFFCVARLGHAFLLFEEDSDEEICMRFFDSISCVLDVRSAIVHNCVCSDR